MTAQPAFSERSTPPGARRNFALLSPAFLDELRARVSLSTVVGRKVRLTKAGNEWKACCPFHQEKTPSFWVNDQKAFYHCLAAETVVMTKAGRRRIADLAGNRVDVLAPSGRWIEAPFASYGVHRLWAIKLSRNGVRKTVFATSRHRWFVRGRAREVLTNELPIGSRLSTVSPDRRAEWSLDPSGVRHGIVFGDGTMFHGRYGTLNLHGVDNMALARWFPNQQAHLYVREGGQPYYRVYGGRAFEGMKDLPSTQAKDTYLLGFLAGYLAADGHVSKDGTVMLNSARREHLDRVRDIADALGIVTYGVTTQHRVGLGDEVTPLYRIHFAASTMAPELFLKDEARRRFVECSKAFERRRWTVERVEPTDRREVVYCAQVPEEHAFALDDHIVTGNCFGCGAHGDAIRFLTETSGLSFMDAVKELAQSAGLDLPTPEPAEIARQERSAGLIEVTEAAARHFERSLAGAAGAAARTYLDQRGVSAETQKTFRVGYAADERNGVAKALADVGSEPLIEAGLLIQVEDKAPYDRFRGRLMIPIRDPRGRVIAFGGRILGSGEPKYLNSPDTPLFDKGRVLFNLDRAAPASRQTGRLIVVEGYLDVLALDQAGIRETVAPMGTALTEQQLELLWRQVDEPILCFDGDSAGKRAAARAAERAMPLLSPGKQLRIALLPEKQDPDDVIRNHGRDAFERLIAAALPLAEFIYTTERTKIDPVRPEQRAGLRKRLAELSDSCADRLMADEFGRSFRRMFNDEFAWKPEHRKAILGAAIRTSPRIAPDLARSPLRSALHGLTRFPQLVAEHLETIGALRIAHPDLSRWRETLIEAALTTPDLDEDGLAAILAINLLPETLQWDVQSDLRFGFLRASESAERSVAQLRTLLRHLGEEQGLGAEAKELDGAALADAAGDDYERIAADFQRVRQSRADLLQRSAEWDLDLAQAI